MNKLFTFLFNFVKKRDHRFSFDNKERNAPYMYYISIVAIFQNESSYLEEWIDSHLRLGVGHFYLYDNNSNDNPLEILDAYVRRGLVTYLPWPTFKSVDTQNAAFAHAIHSHRENSRWMIFIDVDEFLFPTNELNLAQNIKRFEEFSVIKLPWRVFGTNQQKYRVNDSVIRSFNSRVDLNLIKDPFYKSKLSKPKAILDPCRVKFMHVHHPVSWDNKVLTLEKDILLNHYMFKSEEEFISKLNKKLFFSERRYNDYQNMKKLVDSFSVKDELLLKRLDHSHKIKRDS